MVKAARFIVLATAIERNISSYFWLSTCGAANLELSAFGGLRMLFCLSRRKKLGVGWDDGASSTSSTGRP